MSYTNSRLSTAPQSRRSRSDRYHSVVGRMFVIGWHPNPIHRERGSFLVCSFIHSFIRSFVRSFLFLFRSHKIILLYPSTNQPTNQPIENSTRSNTMLQTVPTATCTCDHLTLPVHHKRSFRDSSSSSSSTTSNTKLTTTGTATSFCQKYIPPHLRTNHPQQQKQQQPKQQQQSRRRPTDATTVPTSRGVY